MIPLKNIIDVLRGLTSRVFPARGVGWGATVLTLALFLLAVIAWAYVYENTDGNVTDWIELKDAVPNCTLAQDGSSQKLSWTSVLAESEGVYRYNGASWGSIDASVASGYSVAYPNNLKIYLGARVQTTGSFSTNGYYFSNTGTATNKDVWKPVGITWDSSTVTACAKDGVLGMAWRGTGANTEIKIFSGTNTVGAFSGPSTSTYSTGQLAVGSKYTSTFSAGYVTFSNYFVTDQEPTMTPTATATPTPESNVVRKKDSWILNSWEWLK